MMNFVPLFPQIREVCQLLLQTDKVKWPMLNESTSNFDRPDSIEPDITEELSIVDDVPTLADDFLRTAAVSKNPFLSAIRFSEQ